MLVMYDYSMHYNFSLYVAIKGCLFDVLSVLLYAIKHT